MKKTFIQYFVLGICLLFSVKQAASQSGFQGVAKFMLEVDGSAENKKDSMEVVFGNRKIKTIFYYRSPGGEVFRNEYIDDFASNTTYTIDPQKMIYCKSEMKSSKLFSFTNRNKYNYVLNNLCLLYDSENISIVNSDYVKAECLTGIDFMYEGVENYFFYDVQPLVVDGRVVMDYKVYQKNGMTQKVQLSDIRKLVVTDEFFRLDVISKQSIHDLIQFNLRSFA